MTLAKILTTAALACGLATAAAAQTAPAEPPPKAEPGTTPQYKCIDEDASFKLHDGKPVFYIVFENKCAERLSCRVDSLVTTAKGISQGHATIVLTPKSKDGPSKKIYMLPLKAPGGGNAQSTRACHVI